MQGNWQKERERNYISWVVIYYISWEYSIFLHTFRETASCFLKNNFFICRDIIFLIFLNIKSNAMILRSDLILILVAFANLKNQLFILSAWIREFAQIERSHREISIFFFIFKMCYIFEILHSRTFKADDIGESVFSPSWKFSYNF